MLALKSGLGFFVSAPEVPFFGTWKRALLPKVPGFKWQKMALPAPRQKNGDHFLTPTSPQNGAEHNCFMRLALTSYNPQVLCLSVRHKKTASAVNHPALCTWVDLPAVALVCLMMIMTIWTQSGCHLKRFKNVTFPHFAIFWPFWAKKNFSFKIVIIIIGWSSHTTRLFDFIRKLPL